jgi:hypothetical protein
VYGVCDLAVSAQHALNTSVAPITQKRSIALSTIWSWLFDGGNMIPTIEEELFMLGRLIWILLFTLLILAYVAVALRLWVRFRITKSPGWDDATMVLTLVSIFEYLRRALLTRLDPVYHLFCRHHGHHASSQQGNTIQSPKHSRHADRTFSHATTQHIPC